MSDQNRRSFLKHTAAASAGAAAWAWTGGIHAAGANERLTVGVIGCGGRGAGLAEEFAGLAEVAYVCDPDESRRRRAQEKVRAKHAVADFLDAIKTGRRPNAEIEIGHLSTTLVHLGNLAMRVGRSLNFDPRTEQIIGNDDANRLLGRRYRKEGHWAIPKGVRG